MNQQCQCGKRATNVRGFTGLTATTGLILTATIGTSTMTTMRFVEWLYLGEMLK